MAVFEIVICGRESRGLGGSGRMEQVFVANRGKKYLKSLNAHPQAIL